MSLSNFTVLISLMDVNSSHAKLVGDSQIRALMDETARQFQAFEIAKCMTSDIFCSIAKAFVRLPDSCRENLQNEFYSITENFMQSNSYSSLQNRILEAATLVSDAFRQTTDTATARSAWIDKSRLSQQCHPEPMGKKIRRRNPRPA